ncbi:MAG: putative Chase2 sensor protein, partial [Chthonomonadales bacterium]|nr:putative Chase2 sensor protein [Chthonomonadales bacterium]
MSADAKRFYITGGTLPSHAPSYIVRQADKDLLQGLRAGEFCYVLNTRQIGKSSLMVRAAHQLRAEGHLVALLDLTAIGQNVTIEEWYDGLLTLVAEQLGLRDELEDFWLEHERLGPMQRWMEAIRHVALERRQQKLFLFVDEIDCVRSLPFATDEFFVGIRECYNRRVQDPVFERLTFCLLGVATPADLITDTRLSPFNIGRRIVLADFTFEEALPLAHGLGTSPPKGSEAQSAEATSEADAKETLTALTSDSARSLLKQALDWTGGHPYLTQRLCQALSQAPHPLQTRDVDRLCRELFLHPQAQNTDDNLAFVRNCLLRNEAEASALLDLYQQIRAGKKVREETVNPLHVQLRLSGIVKISQGTLRVRNRIYAQAFDSVWLEANMPDAELRRQRLAYQRGIARAATIFGSLATLIVVLLALAVINASHARSAQRSASHLLYVADMDLAQREWEAGNVGHVLELLGETKHSVERNIEWDYWNRKCHQSFRTFNLPGRIFSTVFAPHGNQIASVTENGVLKIVDVTSGQERLNLPLEGRPCRGVAYAPDGATLAVAVARNVQIRETATGRLLRTLSAGNGDLEFVLYSEDGRFLMSGDLDRVIVVWDVATGQQRFQVGHGNTVRSCTLYGSQLVTCQPNGLVQFWALESGKEVRRIQTSFTGSALALPHNGSLLVGSDARGDVQIHDIATGRVSFHAGNDGVPIALAFTSDASRLIVAHSLTLNIWDMHSGRLLS